jgi:hypothetical protein
LDQLGLAAAAQQVLERTCLRLRQQMAVMAERQLCITEYIMAAAAAGQRVLLVYTAVRAKVEAAELHRQQAAAMVHSEQPRHRHNPV